MTITSIHKGSKILLYFILPYFFIVGIFQFIGSLFLSENFEYNNENIVDSLVILISGCIGTIVVVYIFMKYVEKKPLLDLGFGKDNWLKSIFYGLTLGLFVMLLGLFILKYLGFLRVNYIGVYGLNLILSIILFLIVALKEEILFRGFVLRNLLYSYNKYYALLISSVIFTLMHSLNPNLNWIGTINLFLAGILLGLPYIFHKNLWFSIALHFSWNFFQAVFGFNVSGIRSYSIFQLEYLNANTILTGGEFGFEGSILASIIQFFVIIIVYSIFNRQKLKKKLVISR